MDMGRAKYRQATKLPSQRAERILFAVAIITLLVLAASVVDIRL